MSETPQGQLEPLEDANLFADSVFDAWSYVQVVLARRWLIAALAITFGVYGVYGALRQVPVYTASARLLIESAPGVLGVNDLLPRAQTRQVDETQLQLLQSRNFKIQVIENYGLLPPPRPAAPETTEDGAATTPARPEPAVPETSLYDSIQGLFRSMVGRLRIALAPPQGAQEDPSILPDHMLHDKYAGALARFNAMRVQPINNTNLVQINWTGRDRVFATRMANAVATEFVEYTRTTQDEMSTDASNFLTQEIERLQSEILEDETESAELADRLGVDETANSLGGRGNGALGNQLATARADRVQKESVYRQIQNSEPSALAEIRNSDGPRQGRQALTRLEDQLEEDSKRLTSEHPAIKQLQADIDDARADLQREERLAYDAFLQSARNSFDAAVQAESRLQDMVSGQRGRTAQEADEFARLGVLRTSLANKRRILQTFVDQRENMEVSARLYGMRGSTARVVDWATLPRVPSGQPLRRVLLYHALIGFMVGCVIALGLDFLDNTLRTADDVTRRVGLPTLGSVASMHSAGKGRGYYSAYAYAEKSAGIDPSLPAELIAHQQPRSALAEEYRELRTALLLSSAGGAPRRLLLTSSQPGEGKTTTTCNLAISLAHAGKKVLLVDGDMRRPRLDKIFAKENAPGLANYLAGSAPWQELTLGTEIENLWLLPSGPIPPNPAELFAGNLYGQMTQEALESFDLILVDSPPIEPVVDGLILAQHADGVVLVAKAGVTPHHAVTRARRKLDQVHARLVGVVLNQLRQPGRGGKYYAGYEYGSRAAATSPARKSDSRATS